MIFKKYPNEKTVNELIKKKRPLIIAIPFDESKSVLISINEDSADHHTLLEHFKINPASISKYYCIVLDSQKAVWTFVCPQNYNGIKDKQERITSFYNQGFTAISRVMSELGYFSDLTIPKRYRRIFKITDVDSIFEL